MLKRLIAIIAIATLPASASASNNLAEEWGTRASMLYDQTTTMLFQLDHGVQPQLTDAYLIELERFSLTAGRLGAWMQTTDGADRFSCVYTQLANDSISHLNVLDTEADAADLRNALSQLAFVFVDAEMLAAASAQRTSLPAVDLLHRSADCSRMPVSALH